MAEKPSVIRETDDAARKLARVLLRSARYAALAVLDPDSGFPAVSRVLVGSDIDGAAVILVSSLSAIPAPSITTPGCRCCAASRARAIRWPIRG